jgi:hypothetical protein
VGDIDTCVLRIEYLSLVAIHISNEMTTIGGGQAYSDNGGKEIT